MGATKARRGLTKDQERERAGEVDTIICYLECGDFRPPVRTFVSGLSGVIETFFSVPCDPAAQTGGRWEPLGLLAGARNAAAKFELAAAFPVTPAAVRRASALLPGGFEVRERRAYAKVVNFNVCEDGSARARVPGYYWTDPSHPRGTWFPAVGETAGKMPVHVVTQGGVTYSGYRVVETHTGIVPAVAAHMATVRRHVWCVRIGAKGGRSELLLPTDQDGAVGFFNLRNAPLTAGGRRKALQHWVREHGRKVAPGTDTSVRGHLRGVGEFDWFGLRARVEPPAKLID